jgi:hypothetical protein
LNQNRADLGIPNRFRLKSHRPKSRQYHDAKAKPQA